MMLYLKDPKEFTKENPFRYDKHFWQSSNIKKSIVFAYNNNK
jgi:hypothetical protein